MRFKPLTSASFMLLLLLGCSDKYRAPTMSAPKTFRIPPDFSLNHYRGNGNFFSPLLATTYSVGSDGKAVVKATYVREIKTEGRQLTSEQLETLAKRVDDARLLDFAKQAESLRKRCRFTGTDMPYRGIEFQWNGQRVTIVDDFDPDKCSEVRLLRKFMEDLPQLLEGRLVKAESQAAPWPRSNH